MGKSDSTPLVSVVVPNYNYARYLEQRITSILNQTFTNFELILLDDASTDNSSEVLERYRKNIHVTHIEYNEKNTGSPFQQWMKGIRLAKGKYVWIAEADDCAEPDFLEICVRHAEKEKDTAICYAGSYLFDAEGNVSRKDVNHWGSRSKKGIASFPGVDYVVHNLYWKNYIINASAVLFRREYALNLMDSPFVQMRYCGDWLFWFELSMQGKVVEVYRILNYFRQHTAKATVASRRLGEGVKEDAQILSIMESKLSSLPIYKKRLRRGLLYRKLKRMALDTNVEQEILEYIEEILQCTIADFYLERRNQILRLFCPWLLTAKRDRL